MLAVSAVLRSRLVVLLAMLVIFAGPEAVAQRVGVNSAVNPDASGTPPGANSRRLVLGQEVVQNSAFVISMLGCVLGFGGYRDEATGAACPIY